jgi:hypothetical protein
MNRNAYPVGPTFVATQPPPPASGFRSVLRNRQYLVFLASSNTATMGYSVYAISIVWLTYTVAHNFLVVGGVLFLEYAAYTATFVFAPIVDRVRNQRTIFVASYPVQAVAAATIAIGVEDHFMSVGLLFALVAVLAILWDMTWAAMNAAPGVLLTPNEQFAASGVSGAIGGALTIAGFAIGGSLIVLVGAAGGMYLYAGVLAAAAVLALPLRVTPSTGVERSFRESFREGWKLIMGGEGRPLLQLATVDSIQGFLTAAPPLLITLLAVVVYRGAPAGYAILFTAEVVGGVVAGLVLGRWNPRGSVGLLLPVALLATGGAIGLAVALPANLTLGSAAWFAVGFASAVYVDAKYAFYRGAVAPEKIARLISNMYLFGGTAAAVGALVLSGVADARVVGLLGAAIAAGFVAAGLVGLALPGVRRMKY